MQQIIKFTILGLESILDELFEELLSDLSERPDYKDDLLKKSINDEPLSEENEENQLYQGEGYELKFEDEDSSLELSEETNEGEEAP